jgi:ferric-dicitrate binding protein FerR (iron transport regulator)
MARMRHVVTDPFGPVAMASAAEMRRRIWATVDAQPTGDIPLSLMKDGAVPAGFPERDAPPPSRRQPLLNRMMARPRMRSAWMLGVAAVAVLVFAVGKWAHVTPQRSDVARPYTTYSTVSGQVAHLTLIDGSRVTLAPNTTMGVSGDFEQGRDITLHGEAFFEVTSAATRPFVVHTGNVVTRVLGTKFDVRRYATDTATRVVVVTGKVAAGSPRQSSVTLVAGAMGHLTDSTSVVTPVKDMTTVTGWTAGRLRFREMPAAEVLAQLSRWYGVEFQLADSTIGRESVTTDIDFKETADVIRALEGLLGVTASSGGTHAGVPVVVLRPRRSVSRTPAIRSLKNALESTHMEVGR